MGATPKCHFSQDSQIRSSKILEIGILATLEAHNFLCKPLTKARFLKNYSLYQELSNDMWRATCTHVIKGDFILLVVGNQINTLTPALLSAITSIISIQMDHTNPF
jgi:hypothetical protein